MENIWIDIDDPKELQRTLNHHKEHPKLKFSYRNIDNTDNPNSNKIFYNTKGQKTKIDFESILYHSTTFSDWCEFDFDCICVKLNGKYGLLGTEGMLTEIEFENRIFFNEGSHYEYKNIGIAPVIKNDKLAFINRSGQIVSKFYDSAFIKDIKYNQEYSWDIDSLSVSQNGKFGLLKYDGTEVLPCEFDEPIKGFRAVKEVKIEPLRTIKKDGKYGLATIFGEIIPCILDEPLDSLLLSQGIDFKIRE